MYVQELLPVHFLEETGLREAGGEAVFAGEKARLLVSARLRFKSLTSGRKLTFPEHQLRARSWASAFG